MKSILVIGMGRFGKHLAAKMQDMGNDVMIVDKDEELIEQLSSSFTDSYIGDCTNEGVVRSLGINNFDICFVTIGEDFQASLEITALLKDLGAKRIVSKAKRDRQARFLKNVGADEVVYPEREIAEKLAIRCNSNNVFDYIELTDEYAIYEIPVVPSWVAKSIGDTDVRRKYGINIIAVKNGNNLKATPGAEYVFRPDDHMVVIGKAENVFKLTSMK